MGQGDPFGIDVCLQGSQDSRDAGPDVVAQKDGDGPFQRDQSLAGHRHQDTDGRTGRLDDHSHAQAHQKAQERLRGEAADEFHDSLVLAQRHDGITHHGHAEHQDAETQEDLAAVPDIPFPGKSLDEEADGQDQCNIIRQLESDQLGSDRRPDIGAHDDPEGLLQVHQTGIDEADGHDGRRTRRLQDAGHARTQGDAVDRPLRKLAQDPLQLAAGCLLQPVPHELHPVQEKRNPA